MQVANAEIVTTTNSVNFKDSVCASFASLVNSQFKVAKGAQLAVRS